MKLSMDFYSPIYIVIQDSCANQLVSLIDTTFISS